MPIMATHTWWCMPASTMGWPVFTRLSTSFMKSKLRSTVVPCLAMSLACRLSASRRWVVSVTPDTDRVRICRSTSGPTAWRMRSMLSNGFSPT